jgi:predicted nucleic acid-binding protein
MVWRFLEGISRLHNNVLYVEPHFRFRLIAADPDDDKFADCAITVEADFILTSDRHFDALHSSGYKARPIEPNQFIANHL